MKRDNQVEIFEIEDTNLHNLFLGRKINILNNINIFMKIT